MAISTRPVRLGSVLAFAAALLVPAAVSTAAPTAQPAARPWTPAAPAQVVIDTEGAAPIVSKDDYVNATMTFGGTTHTLRIKGRGNSTWTWPKKPYKLKLDDEAALLGKHKQEDWVLLANYRDRSALRTSAAFALASETNLAWTPRSRHVEVVLNGSSQGLYLLTEQVEQARGRVELPDGAFLLEINERFKRDDEPGFRTTTHRTPVTFKDPDEVTKAQRKQVRAGIEEFEKVLYSRNFSHPTRGYRRFIDVDSFIDWYLVEEFFMNQDSNFQSSVNVEWTPGGKFAMGPVWDFDLSAGTRWQVAVPPTGWHTRQGRHWLSRMLEDPAFALAVKERWRELRPTVDHVVSQIPAAAMPLRTAAEADWKLWHADTPHAGHADSFDGEVSFLADWLKRRAEWMSRKESMWGTVALTTKEKDRTVWMPIRLMEPASKAVTVRYELLPTGTATPGEDFTMTNGNTGSVTFEPGSVVRYIPVQIHADEAPEQAERIQVWLRTDDPEAIIGSPDIATITVSASDQTLDGRIRRAGTRKFLGTGIVDGTGTGQIHNGRVAPGQSQRFDVRVTNTGNGRNWIRLRGERSGPAASVRWFVGKRDVTAKMTRTKGLRVRLAPGAQQRVRMVVTARGRAAAGEAVEAFVRAIWKGDARTVDRVGATLIIRPPNG